MSEPRPDPLAALRRALLRHPVAAQALFAALVAEGRAFAVTPEGADLRRRLERSDLVLRSRAVWEVVTGGAFVEDPDIVMPSTIVEAIAKAAMERRPEARAADAVARADRP